MTTIGDLPIAEQSLLTDLLGAREAGCLRVKVPWRRLVTARALEARGLLRLHRREATMTADGWWVAISRNARRPVGV